MLGLLEGLWWRYRACPHTVEAAAQDFLEQRNPEVVRAVLADPTSWYDFYVDDFKSRIGVIYGLNRTRRPLFGGWSPGWNHRLLAEAGPDPDEAAGRILRRVVALAKERQVIRQE